MLVLWHAFNPHQSPYQRASRGGVMREGSVSAQATFDFSRATGRVEFLFGPEVGAYLDVIARTLIKHHALEGTMKTVTEEDQRHRTAEAQIAAFETIRAFFADFPKLIKPHVKMHQKAPWF